MRINFPEKIENIIKYLTEKKKIDQIPTNNYLIVVEALALYKYVLDNVNDEKILCIFDKKNNEIINELEIEGDYYGKF